MIYVYEEDYQILGFISIIDNYIAGIVLIKIIVVSYHFIKEFDKHLRL